jgi:hypothetical protein
MDVCTLARLTLSGTATGVLLLLLLAMLPLMLLVRPAVKRRCLNCTASVPPSRSSTSPSYRSRSEVHGHLGLGCALIELSFIVPTIVHCNHSSHRHLLFPLFRGDLLAFLLLQLLSRNLLLLISFSLSEVF